MKTSLQLLIIILIAASCKLNKPTNELYVISYQDSLSQKGVPPPPPPPGLKYYSNIVMIFDTSNIIYFYLVDIQDKKGKIIDKGLGQTWSGEEEKYPFFIGLTPKDLTTLNSKYLIDFIKDNDLVFRLDTNFRSTNRFLYLVSDFDTIKNKGFYDILNYIKTSKYTRGRVFYIVRGTTEEAKQVLKFKRSGDYFDPESINWSENFLDGKSKPFTSKYNSAERNFKMVIKKKSIFKENILKLSAIE